MEKYTTIGRPCVLSGNYISTFARYFSLLKITLKLLNGHNIGHCLGLEKGFFRMRNGGG